MNWATKLMATAILIATCFLLYLWVAYLAHALKVGMISPAEWWIGLTPEQAASWTQAAGAISAIMVAFLVPHLEYKRKERAEKSSRLQKVRDNIEAIYDAVADLAIVLDIANANLSTGDNLSDVMQQLVKQVESSNRGFNLLRLSVELLDDEEMRSMAVKSLSDVEEQAERFKRGIGPAQRYEQSHSSDMERPIRHERDRVLKWTQDMHFQLSKLADSLNSLRVHPGKSLLDD